MLRAIKLNICVKTVSLICCVLLALSACSSRTAPAPVVNLSTKVATPENLTQITTDSYTVEAGDTLFAIAFYSGNDYRELATLNNIPAPYTLSLGQSLRLRPSMTSQVVEKTVATKPSAHTSITKKTKPQKPQVIAEQKSRRQSVSQKSTSGAPISTEQRNTNLGWAWPASGTRTVATVGSDGSKRGLDIKGKLGDRVLAAASGKVVYAGNALKGYGNLIIIKHNSDYLSAYAHNNAILVNEQTYVRQGQQIATMGNSGASEVMLHFEIRKKGKSIDPFQYLPAQ